jgi:hypothetical protein
LNKAREEAQLKIRYIEKRIAEKAAEEQKWLFLQKICRNIWRYQKNDISLQRIYKILSQ